MAIQSGDGKATTTRSTFRLRFAVTRSIEATATTVWSLLTDLRAQAKWNSTLTSIEGKVAIGQRVSFKVPAAPGQTFSPKVVAYDEPHSMVWRLNRWPLLLSERTYRLSPGPDGSTEFALDEVFSGLLLPVIAKSLPDFAAMFERTARDLQAAAQAAAPP
ncbi:MAG: SRPBCC family protein [Candidatus Dormibacterales bacterium]